MAPRWCPPASYRVTLPDPGIAQYAAVGHGDALVFLHGLGGDHSNWQPQLDAFGPTHHCVAWTLPGYGDSPPLDEMTWPNLADMVVRVLDDANVDRACIVGLSMGGYIAQQLAASHPDRVSRLVLAGTTAQFGRGSASFAEKFLASRLKPIDEDMTMAELAPTIAEALLSSDAPAEATANAVASMSRISTDAYRQALQCLVTWDFVDSLDQISAPTLCLAGEHDRTAPVAAVKALADSLADSQFVVLEHANHLMNLDRPDAFNAAVRSFVQ